MKKYNVFFAVMLSMMLVFSVSASAKQVGRLSSVGYDLELDPGVNVVDNNDGTHAICDTFDFYYDGLNNQDLTAADFIVYEDEVQVNATIIPPGSSTVLQKADIIFCMDISGSMGSEINAVKANTQGFVDALARKNFDVQLGLITFGGHPTILEEMNNGQFYADTGAFLTDFNTLKAFGGTEPWFDANVLASQYPFRQGASRVIILITDENGNKGTHTIDSSITAVNNNAVTVYSITYENLRNAVRAATETGGKYYNIKDPFSSILDDIAQQIANRYSVCYLSNAGPGIHELKVEIAQNGNYDIAFFTIGANPVVTLSQATLDMVRNGVAPDGSILTIQAEVKDDGSVASVDIYGTDASGLTFNEFMTDMGNSLYSYDIAGPSAAGDCFDFSIKAIDDEGRVTISGPYTICASADPPVIGAITPDAYDYNLAIPVTVEVTDPDNDLARVTLETRNRSTQNWSAPLVMTASGSTYSVTLDSSYAGFGGVELRITATDQLGKSTVAEKTLTMTFIPVTVIDVTTHRDIIDKEGDGEGPFSVYAVVAGVDINTGSSVTLFYTVNGGAQNFISMIQTVTGTQAPLNINSNIYFAEIPTQSPGDRICYYVEATNPTPDSDSSFETCFEIIQPAEPLALTPAYALVTPGETVSFVATGGFGSYQWQALNGSLSTTLGDTATYTAGIVGDGWDKVSIKDLRGFTATAEIRVLPPLAINPDVDGKKFSPSSTVILRATGGEPDYTWEVTNADSFTVGANSTEVEILLGAEPADITAVLTDAKGRQVRATFRNNGALTISPCCDVPVQPGEEETFTVTGGAAPYTWTVLGGDLDNYSSATVTYRAPELPGSYGLIVEDANGDTATLKIQAGIPLRVTPGAARILRGESQTFEVVTGMPPYRWMAQYGDLSSTTGEKVTYTPENFIGIYEVIVIDAVDAMKILTVEVSEGLVVTPSVAEVQKGKSKTFTVNGGQGGYLWSVVRGSVSPMQGREVVYTAPDNLGDGKDTLTVRDKAGNAAIVDITVTEGALDILTISPFEATLALGETLQFTVNNAKDPANVHWTATKGIVSREGLYKAPESSGTYTVTVTDILNGRSAQARVFVKSELTLTPGSASVGANDARTFTVSGGETPYNWRVVGEGDLDSTTGESVVFTATTKAGTSFLIVIDNTGKEAQAEIETTGSIVISPAGYTLAPLEEITFTASGVSGTISWASEKGLIDGNGNYTAPPNLGTDTVTATDTAGNEATATITVSNIPVITPAMAWLEKGDSTTFDVVGGNPPYAWSVTAGDITGSASSATYTAPDVSGEYTVTVRDDLGQESQAVVFVEIELQANRQEIYLKPGETTRVAVTGGIPPFDWQASTGEMGVVTTANAGFNFYTAPDFMGDDTITIRDRRNSLVTVTVHVTQPLQVTPNVRYMKRETSRAFTVVSGVAPFTAAVLDGDGDIVPDTPVTMDSGLEGSADGKFTFTSGTTADEDVVIEFTDNTGQAVQVHAFVETRLKVTPGIIYLDKEAKASFRVTGGTEGYDAIATSGIVKVDQNTGIGTYESPNRYGEYTISVFDSSDNELQISVVVERSNPVISPSGVSVDAGEKRSFMVNLGAPPYEWTFEGGRVSYKGKSNSTVTITAPDISGVYKLTASDAAGNTAEANVTVSLPMLLSPSAVTVYQGTAPSVRVSVAGGIPPYQWITNEISNYDERVGFVVLRPFTRAETGTTYSVECRDASGATAGMNIIVSRIPGDLNGDGVLSAEEMLNVIDRYVEDAALEGISLDPETVYDHVEAYQNNK